MSNRRPSEFPYEVSSVYERFNQKYVIFARWIWDEKIREWKEALLLPRPVERIAADDRGYGLLDYALRSGGWYLDGFNDTVSAMPGHWNLYAPLSLSTSHSSIAAQPWNSDPELERTQREFKTQSGPEVLTKAVKKAARFLGADLVGIAPYDERWVYSHLWRRNATPGEPRELPLKMPPGVTSVVVLAFEMEYGALNTSPAALAMAATGLGYSRMAFVTSSLAEFIRSLGYWAQPCGNDTALSVPLAIAAGLGEAGRQGLLITREYGPRVRLAKIFTDMPLLYDEPVSFGVWEFCKRCKKCAKSCPPRAISFDEPSWEGPSISNNPGVLKWYIDPEKCFRFWCQNGWSCSNCLTRCPYSKDYSNWYHRVAREVAPKLGSFALWLDDALGYGKQASTEEWWGLRS